MGEEHASKTQSQNVRSNIRSLQRDAHFNIGVKEGPVRLLLPESISSLSCGGGTVDAEFLGEGSCKILAFLYLDEPRGWLVPSERRILLLWTQWARISIQLGTPSCCLTVGECHMVKTMDVLRPVSPRPIAIVYV